MGVRGGGGKTLMNVDFQPLAVKNQKPRKGTCRTKKKKKTSLTHQGLSEKGEKRKQKKNGSQKREREGPLLRGPTHL